MDSIQMMMPGLAWPGSAVHSADLRQLQRMAQPHHIFQQAEFKQKNDFYYNICSVI